MDTAAPRGKKKRNRRAGKKATVNNIDSRRESEEEEEEASEEEYPRKIEPVEKSRVHKTVQSSSELNSNFSNLPHILKGYTPRISRQIWYFIAVIRQKN